MPVQVRRPKGRRVPLRLGQPHALGAPDAHLATPWFSRDGAAALDAAPALLTFTDTDFLERFLGGLTRRLAGTRQPFPQLVPMRDWCEPPRATRDAAGDSLLPPGIARAPVDAEAATGEGGLDAEAVLRAEEAATGTGWLRKLYLPSHRHFHLVASELICDHGYTLAGDRPALDPARVIEVGAVIRRLVTDPGRERWEDWLAVEEGRGVWAEIADPALRGAMGAPLDPAAPDPLPALALAVRARLGLSASAPIPALSPVRLGPLPPDRANKRSTWFAYLPISSREVELPERSAPATAAELRAEAAANLDRALGADPAAPRARVRAAWDGLLQALSGPDASASRFGPAPLDGGTAALEALQLAVEAARPPTEPAIGLAVDRGQLAAWMREEATAMAGLDLVAPRWDDVAGRWIDAQPAWARPALAARLSHVRIALRGALQTGLQLARDGAWTPPATTDHRLVAAVLLWVRAHRILLHRSFRAVLPAPDLAVMPPEARTVPDPHAPSVRVTAATVSSLAGELEAYLVADEERARAPRPWPPLPMAGENAVRAAVHRASLSLEQALAELDRVGGAGGSGWPAMRDGRAQALRGDPGLSRALGLDLDAQPESGLLAIGALRFDAVWPSIRQEVLDHYVASPALDSEARAAQSTIRPRFDPDHVYAAWVYARVADGRPCRSERLIWSARTEVFSIADPNDLLGLKPVALRLPDLPQLLRDLPRIARAGALPVAAVTTPPDSGWQTGEEPQDTARQWGIAWICSFGIPVFTICAWILFKIVLSILLLLPGFGWMLLLKFCLPVPVPRRAS